MQSGRVSSRDPDRSLLWFGERTALPRSFQSFAPAFPDALVHFLPFSAGYRLLDAGPNFKPPVVIAHELARGQYALIFGGYAMACLTIGAFLLYRRDA